ncbi:hypothetical protein BGZ83_008891 [Gryganskiella cystojenkinii]|nr:hypothetical protein BGZ83_008891 [Gryganskiella cystojenkinii]
MKTFEAQVQATLLNIIEMDDPVRQIRIEKEEMKDDWQKIMRYTKEVFKPGRTFLFLTEDLFLDHDIAPGFVQRFNLAMTAQEIFTPEPIPAKLEKGLTGLVRFFRPPQSDDQDDERTGIFWKTFLQLVTLVVALQAKAKGEEDVSSERIERIMKSLWSFAKPPPVISDHVRTDLIVDIARRVIKDDNHLYGLFQNTLKLVKKQLEEILETVPPPADQEMVEIIATGYRETIQEQYSKPTSTKTDTRLFDDIDAVWFQSSEAAAVTLTELHFQSQDPFVDSNSSHAPEDFDFGDQEYQANGGSDTVHNDASPEQAMRGKKKEIEEEAEEEEEEDEPLIRRRLSSDKGKGRRIEDAPSSEISDGEEKENTELIPAHALSRSLLKRPPKPLMQRVANASGVRVREQDADSEFEDDGASVPQLQLKKRKVTLPPSPAPALAPETESSTTQANSAGPSTNNNRINDRQLTRSVSSNFDSPDRQSQSPPPTKKARKKYRPWSGSEVDRLMELVPRFQYSEADQPTKGTRKRTVKWSKLKRYDEDHGNVLRHRDQVMLKDKYRDQTDQGRHRQQVAVMNCTKNPAAPRHQFPKNGNPL